MKDFAKMFHRALERIFDVKKFLSVFLVLLISGLIYLFFQGIAIVSPAWMKLPLLSLPFYIMCFLLMVGGAGIIQAYVNQKEGKTVQNTFFFSKDAFLKASYFFVPFILAAIFLLILLGIFVLIKSLAYLGTFLGIILAFAPFLINFCLLLFLLAAFFFLFFFTPLIASGKQIDRNLIQERLKMDLFTHVLFFIVAMIPLMIVAKFSLMALLVTFGGYSAEDPPLIKVLQGLFILIPLSAILTFPLLFFFNFASEAYEAKLASAEAGNKSPQENASYER